MNKTASKHPVSALAEDAPSTLERLIRAAEDAGASDLHIQMRGTTAEVSYRFDGVLTPGELLPDGLADRVIGRIKFLAKLQSWQDSLPQDGRIARQDVGSRHDLRVATYPTVTGEKAVLRLFTPGGIKALAELGFDPKTDAALNQFLRRPSGLLLLTGPAGSGKTTTIYACIQELASKGRHIITVEDPVEQILPAVMQTEVNEARGLTFAKAARHLLRQDPQVLVIGEIRDEETATIAIGSALTGHLVISTLHAGSCQGVLERLLVLCRDHSALAAAVDLLLNQRLLRRLCQNCRGKGCAACVQTGYRGRVPVTEWLIVDESLRRGLRRGEIPPLPEHLTLEAAAQSLVPETTNPAELSRVLGAGPDPSAAPPVLSV